MNTRKMLLRAIGLLALGSSWHRAGRSAPAYRLLGRRGPRAVLFTMLAIAISFTSSASAQDSVWIKATSSWYDPAGWQGGVPNSTRNAFINNGGVVQHLLSIPAAARSLTLGSNFGESGTVLVTALEPLGIGNDLIVGNGGTGTLAISNGGDVRSYYGISTLGMLTNSLGSATVTGAGSIWSNYRLSVGEAGAGTLRIQDGGKVFTGFGATIGASGDSTGVVTVTGLNSIWDVNNGQSLYVGGIGTGTLTVADTATVNVIAYYFGSTRHVSINSLSTINIGAGGLAGTLDAEAILNNGTLNFDHTDAISQSAAISGTGQIVKNGAGSTTLTDASAFAGVISSVGGELILQGSLNAPLYSASTGGTLRFDGSTVNMSGTNAIRSTGGTVEYSGATVNGGVLRGQLPAEGSHTIVVNNTTNTRFNGVTIQNSVNLIQDGAANFTNVTNGGRLTNNAFLFFDGGTNTTSGNIIVNNSFNTRDFTNYGQITVNSGGSLFHKLGNLASGGGSRTTVNAGGLLNLMDGSELDLNGALLVNNGDINGTVNVNYGSLATGSGSYGVVNVNQGGVYAPGNSPGIVTAESLQFANTSIIGAPILAIEIGGTAPGSEHDQVNVTGLLSLGGTLDVSLLPGFDPVAGHAFDILNWGSLNGTFASIHLPILTGLQWDTSLLYTTGELSLAAAALTGDYNGNGIVDAADYTVWRDSLGATGAGLVADGDGSELVDAGDLEVWQANFGATLGSGANEAATIPEPATAALLMIVGAIALCIPAYRRPYSKRKDGL